MNLPNKITTFRMVMVIVLILLLTICGGLNFTGPYLWGNEETGVSLIRFIAFVLFIAASVSDFLDGYLARKLNLVTTYGKFMDPIADKLLVDSVCFARDIENLMSNGNSTLTFVIGGSTGVSSSLIKRANFRLCLSPMTFTHLMTRGILLEQIYRAFMIINNKTYHK